MSGSEIFIKLFNNPLYFWYGHYFLYNGIILILLYFIGHKFLSGF